MSQGLVPGSGYHRHMVRIETGPVVIFDHAIEDGSEVVSSGGVCGHVTIEEPRAAA